LAGIVDAALCEAADRAAHRGLALGDRVYHRRSAPGSRIPIAMLSLDTSPPCQAI